MTNDMAIFFQNFWLCFVPIFIAVDALGILPLYLSLTHDIATAQLNRIIWESVLTAAFVAMAFVLIGRALLTWIGITISDVLIAGGILLFVLAMNDLLHTVKIQRQVEPEQIGAVPLGVPLIAGPAVLATSLLLQEQYGTLPTAAAVLANVSICGLVFRFARRIHHLLGNAGTRISSKVASLLLAAIAVMMIRRGIFAALEDVWQ